MARLLCIWLLCCTLAQAQTPFRGTELLTMEGDVTSQLVEGVDRFLLKQLQSSIESRKTAWPKPTSEHHDYLAATDSLRKDLMQRIGMRDQRIDGAVTIQSRPNEDPWIARTQQAIAYTVRWPVFEGVEAEGLMIVPHQRDVRFCMVLIPDAGQMPEDLCSQMPSDNTSSVAWRLAANGGAVLIPQVISRHREARLGRAQLTDQEFLYRTAFELGRHILGYQVQESLGGLDALCKIYPNQPRWIAGWGEGGWIALHAAAVDTRIDTAIVSGHFGPRENLWQEPIHRNVHGLLRSFGDAQLAALVAPRLLCIDAQPGPSVDIPGQGGAPGKLHGPSSEEASAEAVIAKELLEPWKLSASIDVIAPAVPLSNAISESAIERALKTLPNRVGDIGDFTKGYAARWERLEAREGRRLATLRKWDRFQQRLLESIASERNVYWSQLDTTTPEKFQQTIEPYRDYFREEVIGQWKIDRMPANPRTRLVYDQPKWKGYEVVLDVFPDVIAYGVLLMPKDAQPGDHRPCIVFQHGLEGRPKDVIEGDHYAYHDVAAKLCEQGYVVFAPQNLYIFEDRFRTLQRKSNPLGRTLFSTIVPQHQQIVDWLKTLGEVDPKRIAFYGLSYGGKSAMRIPALVPDYCLSICSADFNDWVWKNASTTSPYSYVWTGEYEIFEFDLGTKFNYAEMAALIAPRPFMVERGHFDTVAPDERVGLEYAKVQNLYAARLKIPDRTQIEWFDGPHTINGRGTFEFLRKHLSFNRQP